MLFIRRLKTEWLELWICLTCGEYVTIDATNRDDDFDLEHTCEDCTFHVDNYGP